MYQHYTLDTESKRDKGLGSSDPTPTLPESEGVTFVINGANYIPIGQGQAGENESSTANETFSPPLEGPGEVLGRVTNSTNQTKGTGGRKPGYITANPYTYPIIKDYRNDLKVHQTEAERVIWEYLRNKRAGYRIRRQHIIGDFITDFVCLSKKVIIEIDGEIHKFQKEQDNLRTMHLNKIGYEIIRFTNDEVLNAPYQVAQKIKSYLDNMQNSIPQNR